jgi:hypothetical protein
MDNEGVPFAYYQRKQRYSIQLTPKHFDIIKEIQDRRKAKRKPTRPFARERPIASDFFERVFAAKITAFGVSLFGRFPIG